MLYTLALVRTCGFAADRHTSSNSDRQNPLTRLAWSFLTHHLYALACNLRLKYNETHTRKKDTHIHTALMIPNDMIILLI